MVSSFLHERALVMGNTLAGAEHRVLGVNTAGLHVSNNVLTSAPVAVEIEGAESYRELSCNLHWAVDEPGALPIGEDDNVHVAPGFRDVAARDCRLSDEAQYGRFGSDRSAESRNETRRCGTLRLAPWLPSACFQQLSPRFSLRARRDRAARLRRPRPPRRPRP